MTEWVKRPKRYVPDLRQLGALCDGNYQRLRKLRQLESDGKPVCEFELHRENQYLGRVRIEVLQTAKFTETLLLEQVHNSGRWLNNPQMTRSEEHTSELQSRPQ